MGSTTTQKTRKTLTFNNDGVEEVRAGAKALVNAGALAKDRKQTKDLRVEIILLQWVVFLEVSFNWDIGTDIM